MVGLADVVYRVIWRHWCAMYGSFSCTFYACKNVSNVLQRSITDLNTKLVVRMMAAHVIIHHMNMHYFLCSMVLCCTWLLCVSKLFLIAAITKYGVRRYLIWMLITYTIQQLLYRRLQRLHIDECILYLNGEQCMASPSWKVPKIVT